MPELPEVETITRDLKKLLTGDTIRTVTVLSPRNLRGITAGHFRKILSGKKILSIVRRGKAILFNLSGHYTLLVHLKMTGQFYYPCELKNPEPHTYLMFDFKTAGCLGFRDIRTFAVVYLKPETEIKKLPYISTLGIDPTRKEYTFEYFHSLIKKHHKRNIKSFLLDQTILAGIGNIYAAEILFKSRVSPLRTMGSLQREEINRLYKLIRIILLKAITYRGTTKENFKDVEGRTGRFQTLLAVYGRKGESCFICTRTIQRIVQSGRSTFFCPHCQR